MNVSGILHLTRRSRSRLGVTQYTINIRLLRLDRLGIYTSISLGSSEGDSTTHQNSHLHTGSTILFDPTSPLARLFTSSEDYTIASSHLFKVQTQGSLSFLLILLIELGMPCAVNPKLLYHATMPRTCTLKCQSGTVGV